MRLMTETAPPTPTAPPEPALKTRVALQQYSDLRRAQEAAERIVDNRIPESAVTVTAAGIRAATADTTETGYLAAAVKGARAGATFGAIFGTLWSVAGFTSESRLVVAVVFGTLLGIAVGTLIGVAAHWGERDPERSRGLLAADEFHLLVEETYEHAARDALRDGGRVQSSRFTRA